jgi:hypothetical protein
MRTRRGGHPGAHHGRATTSATLDCSLAGACRSDEYDGVHDGAATARVNTPLQAHVHAGIARRPAFDCGTDDGFGREHRTPQHERRRHGAGARHLRLRAVLAAERRLTRRTASSRGGGFLAVVEPEHRQELVLRTLRGGASGRAGTARLTALR